MISKSHERVFLFSLLLCAAFFSGCGRQADAPKPVTDAGGGGAKSLEKVNFQLDWYPSAEHGGHFQALAKNYYRDGGLDVNLVAGGPGPTPLQAVATGRMDLAMGRCDDVILAVSQGLPLVIVCAQMQHDPQSIMVHDDSSVKTFKDLDGRSVMAGPGANWTKFVMGHYGINFSIIPSDWGIGHFMADKDFIQQVFITNEPFFAEQHGVKTRTLLIASGGYDPYRVIFTNRNFLEKHPEAVRAFVAATIHGYVDYLQGDATVARNAIQAQNPTQTPALIDYSIAAMKSYKLVEGDPAKGERMGLITAKRMNELMATLVGLKALPAPLPLDQFVRFDFLPPELAAASP